MITVEQAKEMTIEEAIRRWPRLVSHMMCESLGYFTPQSAALALIRYKREEVHCCEWYSHMSQYRGKGMFDKDEIIKIGADVVRCAFANRHDHEGYMSDYGYARKLVKAEIKESGFTSNMLAGWF